MSVLGFLPPLLVVAPLYLLVCYSRFPLFSLAQFLRAFAHAPPPRPAVLRNSVARSYLHHAFPHRIQRLASPRTAVGVRGAFLSCGRLFFFFASPLLMAFSFPFVFSFRWPCFYSFPLLCFCRLPLPTFFLVILLVSPFRPSAGPVFMFLRFNGSSHAPCALLPISAFTALDTLFLHFVLLSSGFVAPLFVTAAHLACFVGLPLSPSDSRSRACEKSSSPRFYLQSIVSFVCVFFLDSSIVWLVPLLLIFFCSLFPRLPRMFYSLILSRIRLGLVFFSSHENAYPVRQ